MVSWFLRDGKTKLLFLVVILLLVSVPVQYLVRKEVVVGIPSSEAHSHAHDEGEVGHAHDDEEGTGAHDEGEDEHAHQHEHTEEEGHLATEVPLGINLIPNYGFEVGTRERVPGWLGIYNPQGAVSYRDEDEAYEGLACAAVYAEDAPVEGAGWIASITELPLGHDVVVEGKVKTEIAQGGAYLVAVYQYREGEDTRAEFAFSPGVTGSSEWMPQGVRLYVPPEATAVYVEALVFGQGRAWFDNVTLVVEEPESSGG
ncbi:MAG: hypothetical protein HPY75_03760 [Actinobacteria bacterium]|nr:hypothetical protein [Actinomycetota bacterium]